MDDDDIFVYVEKVVVTSNLQGKQVQEGMHRCIVCKKYKEAFDMQWTEENSDLCLQCYYDL